MRNPILSIVVPSYNQGQFIEECLREPLRLAARGVEIIVMDGGSEDGTTELISKLLGDAHYWESEKDRGQAHAINKGFARATGEWIAFQNSDDFYLPGKLDHILDIMQSDNQSDLIIGGMESIDEFGKVFRAAYPKPLVYWCFSQLNFINNQALFVRRSLLARAGHLDESLQFCLDYDWFLRLLQSRPKIKYVRELIGAQRFHAATKTSTLGSQHDLEFAVLSKRHFSLMERILGRILLPPYRVFRFLYGLS